MADTDHVLAAALAFLSLSLLFKKAAPATPASRRSFYAAGAATGILVGVITLLLWHLAGRDLGEFGLKQWVGDAIVTTLAAGAWTLTLSVGLALVHKGALGEWLVGIYSKYETFMPASRSELVGSWGTAVAAGAGEEIAYRGFLLWYGSAAVGLPGALIGTSILFGIAHGYQRGSAFCLPPLPGWCLE